MIAELRAVLPRAKANYTTLSGSGEPTLSLHVGRLIQEIKKLTSIPVAVLTNGSLLGRSDLDQELLGADLMIPSLDAGSQKVFERINRPCFELSISGIIDGLERFSIRRENGLTYFGCAHDSEQELIPCQDRPSSDV
ncbi:MAG: hypothetical protein VB144_03990 [Clostridia bacterium]|nr:hypothetical protein [Clostridia bacterium]